MGDITRSDPFVPAGEIKVGILCKGDSVVGFEAQRRAIDMYRVFSFGYDVY